MIFSDKLIGMRESDAKDFCIKNKLNFSVVYTNDKKTVGNDKIVIAVRETDNNYTLIVCRLMLGIKEEL